jgi:hypothetical protein
VGVVRGLAVAAADGPPLRVARRQRRQGFRHGRFRRRPAAPTRAHSAAQAPAAEFAKAAAEDFGPGGGGAVGGGVVDQVERGGVVLGGKKKTIKCTPERETGCVRNKKDKEREHEVENASEKKVNREKQRWAKCGKVRKGVSKYFKAKTKKKSVSKIRS